MTLRESVLFIFLGLNYKKDPNQKINIWEILKNAIGKDLTRFAVPV
jgi:hypothetical protein